MDLKKSIGKKVFKGVLLGNRIYISDVGESRELWSMGFYGKPLGIAKPKSADFDKPLILDLIEAAYLMEKSILRVYDVNGNELTLDEIFSIGEKNYDKFLLRYLVYKDLRDKGFVVISGLKFGVDFAVYRKGPGLEHAPFLVDVIESGTKIGSDELVRAGRLATSVRKRFIYAIVDDKKIKYVLFKWFKP